MIPLDKMTFAERPFQHGRILTGGLILRQQKLIDDDSPAWATIDLIAQAKGEMYYAIWKEAYGDLLSEFHKLHDFCRHSLPYEELDAYATLAERFEEMLRFKQPPQPERQP